MTTNALTVLTGSELATTGSGLDNNPAAVYLASLESAHSRRTMRGALDKVAGMVADGQDALTLPWANLRYQHVLALRSSLLAEISDRTGKPLSYQTINKTLSAIRRTMRECWRLKQIPGEEYQLIADVPNVKGETLPAGRSLSQGELHALMNVCAADQTAAGIRDGAIIAILYSCGLRRAELVGLNLDDYDLESRALVIRGKRNKERLAYAVNGTVDALADWLTIRGDAPGALFWGVAKGGAIRARRLTTQAIYHILGKRALQAGIPRLSPHDFRRTFVGDLLDAGADISTVQKLAGHSNVQTTARYDRRPEAAKRKAATLLHVPYTKRVLDV